MSQSTRERGAALIVVLMATSLLMAATVGLVMATRAETAVAAAFRSGLQAHYLAEAGLHRAIADLRALPDWTAALDGTATSSFADGPPHGLRSIPGGPTVDLDRVQSLATCGQLSPCSDDDVVTWRPWGPDNPRWRPYAHGPSSRLGDTWADAGGPAYVLVLIADDPAESDGNPERDGSGSGDGAGVVRLRAEAFGPGGARRTVEAVVARPALGGRVRVIQWRRVP